MNAKQALFLFLLHNYRGSLSLIVFLLLLLLVTYHAFSFDFPKITVSHQVLFLHMKGEETSSEHFDGSFEEYKLENGRVSSEIQLFNSIFKSLSITRPEPYDSTCL